MDNREKIGRVFAVYSGYNRRWSYIEDEEGQTLFDVDYWKYTQEYNNPFTPLALIPDCQQALMFCQTRNRELDALERVEDDPDESELIAEQRHHYYQMR